MKLSHHQKTVLYKYRARFVKASKWIGMAYIASSVLFALACIFAGGVTLTGWAFVSGIVGALGLASTIALIIEGRFWEKTHD